MWARVLLLIIVCTAEGVVEEGGCCGGGRLKFTRHRLAMIQLSSWVVLFASTVPSF